MREEDFRPGDQFKVTKVPGGIGNWAGPDGIGTLKNGDVITLLDPPTIGTSGIRLEFQKTSYSFLLRFNIKDHHMGGVMLLEWVELEDEPCRCDIMATGCVCGAFQREQQKGAGG